WIGPSERDAAARAGLHREDGGAELVAAGRVSELVLSGIGRREDVEVPEVLGARAAPTLEDAPAQEHRLVFGEARGVRGQALGRHPARADARVVDQVLADFQAALGADTAAKQDRGRAVRSRGDHDGASDDLAPVGKEDAAGALPVEPYTIDEHVGDD